MAVHFGELFDRLGDVVRIRERKEAQRSILAALLHVRMDFGEPRRGLPIATQPGGEGEIVERPRLAAELGLAGAVQ